MGGAGGFNPSPMLCGGAASTDLEAIQNGFAELLGTALSKEKGSLQWIENHATARVLAYLYGLTRRLGYQNDPIRMTGGSLERWEGILAIQVGTHDTSELRRERVAAKLSLIGKGTAFQVLNDYLARILGPMYQGLIFSDPLTATTYVPGGGSVPGGGPTFVDGALAGPSISPYASSLGYFAIKLERPLDMTEAEFYDRAGRIYDDVDNLIGAWMDFDWIQDGPNGAGFYLDQDANLDNQRFDE